MSTTATAAMTPIRTTLDGRAVEVRSGWVCLAGNPEAQVLIPVAEHPNRAAILQAVPDATHMAGRIALNAAEAALAQSAMDAWQGGGSQSPAAIAQRLRNVMWAKSALDGVE